MKTEKLISMWAKTLFSVQQGKSGKEWAGIIKRTVEIFKKKKKEALLPEVLKRLEKLFKQNQAIELVLARPHSTDTIDRLEKALKKSLGKEKEVKVRIDEEILGGFRAKAKGVLVKASVKDFLYDIKNNYH